jgi:hypothetical protein
MSNLQYCRFDPIVRPMAACAQTHCSRVSVICLAAVAVAAKIQFPLAAARIGKISVSQIVPTVQYSTSARLVLGMTEGDLRESSFDLVMADKKTPLLSIGQLDMTVRAKM